MYESSNDVSNADWVVKGLIFVKYQKDDILGMFFGYYSLLVYQIHAVYITLFLWNRDLMTFYCCFTHLLSEIMNYFLKRALKHPRPDDGAPVSGGLFEGKYGMPSQHCHCFSFLFTTLMFLVFHYYRKRVSLSKKLLFSLISITALILQVLARVYLKQHTVNQCLVGLGVGFFSASVFYFLGLKFFMPHANSLCKLWILRIFSFRKDLNPTSQIRSGQELSRQTKSSKIKRT